MTTYNEEMLKKFLEQTKIVPLHEDLEPWLEETDVLGTVLKHPLVFSIPHNEFRNDYANALYMHKKVETKKAVKNKQWELFIMLHERPYRINAFRIISHLMDDADYWEILASVWTDSENIRENYNEWEDMLNDDRPGKEHIMDEDERKALAALPEIITIYQGHTDERDDGWSWTTDRSVAEWFGRRFADLENGTPQLTIATVQRDDVLGYLLGRSESEILVDPQYVSIQETHEI